MSRPDKKDADWFKHYKHERNDRRIKALKQRHGLEGYAIYMMMLEILCEAPGIQIDIEDNQYELIAADFGIDIHELREIIGYLEKLNVFNTESGYLRCPDLDGRLKDLFARRVRTIEVIRNELNILNNEFLNQNAAGIDIEEKRIADYNREKDSRKKESVGEDKQGEGAINDHSTNSNKYKFSTPYGGGDC
jgi:hypothetical protein